MTDKYLKLTKELKENPEKIDELVERVNDPQYVSPYATARAYTPKSKSARIAQYQKSKELRAKALENRVPFICPEFDPDFFLCQGMTLVCAESGKSKSTTCANIIAGFIQYVPGKQIVVITNEENTDAVIDRTACILNGKNYIDMYKRKMHSRDRVMVEETALRISEYVDVVDDDTWDMTCLEDVQAVLENAVKSGVNLILIDYLQTITHSREHPEWEPFKVSKQFGLYLKHYGKKVSIPVVVFAQLYAKERSPSVAERIQNDKNIYNHAYSVIEIIPDFNTLMTEFIIHKGRFELRQGKKIVMSFNAGKYEIGVDL